jgi:hypothetical protein
MQHNRQSFWCLFLMSVLLFLGSGASAQEISVRNKPYKGEVKGRGVEALVNLSEMAKALDLAAAKTPNGWTLGGAEVPTVEEAGTTYVKLSDLTAAGVKVTLNKDFNIIDITRPVAKTNDSSSPDWSKSSSGLTLVYFGAPW